MVAIAVPSLNGLNEKWRLEGAAWRLASDMRLARQLAISSGQYTMLEFRWHGQSYRLHLPEGRKTIKLPEGITFAYTSFKLNGTFQCSLSPQGAPSPAGTVGFKNRRGDKLYVIITPATGRVRVSTEAP